MKKKPKRDKMVREAKETKGICSICKGDPTIAGYVCPVCDGEGYKLKKEMKKREDKNVANDKE